MVAAPQRLAHSHFLKPISGSYPSFGWFWLRMGKNICSLLVLQSIAVIQTNIFSMSLQQRLTASLAVSTREKPSGHRKKSSFSIQYLNDYIRSVASVLGTAVQGRHWHPRLRSLEGHLDGGGTFFLQDTQELTVHSPEQPILFGSDLSRWFDQMISKDPSQPNLFYNSMSTLY